MSSRLTSDGRLYDTTDGNMIIGSNVDQKYKLKI